MFLLLFLLVGGVSLLFCCWLFCCCVVAVVVLLLFVLVLFVLLLIYLILNVRLMFLLFVPVYYIRFVDCFLLASIAAHVLELLFVSCYFFVYSVIVAFVFLLGGDLCVLLFSCFCLPGGVLLLFCCCCVVVVVVICVCLFVSCC